jgi:hypothetical protein
VVNQGDLRGTGHVEENKNAYRVLEGKPEIKTPLPIHRWKVILKGIRGMDWIDLAKVRDM